MGLGSGSFSGRVFWAEAWLGVPSQEPHSGSPSPTEGGVVSRDAGGVPDCLSRVASGRSSTWWPLPMAADRDLVGRPRISAQSRTPMRQESAVGPIRAEGLRATGGVGATDRSASGGRPAGKSGSRGGEGTAAGKPKGRATVTGFRRGTGRNDSAPRMVDRLSGGAEGLGAGHFRAGGHSGGHPRGDKRAELCRPSSPVVRDGIGDREDPECVVSG